MEAKYGVRDDDSIWISLGDPKTGPHCQFDVDSEFEAKLICDEFAKVQQLAKSVNDLTTAYDRRTDILNNHIAREKVLEDALKDPKWICFHCGFETTDRKEAHGHFGDRDDENPLCFIWADLDSDGKASEFQSTQSQLLEEQDENLVLRSTIQGLEYRLLEFENLIGSSVKKLKQALAITEEK